MLPDVSTASIKARPVCSRACGGAGCCGRAAAHTTSNHASIATTTRPRRALPPDARANAICCGKCSATPGAAGGRNRHASHGNGNSANIHGHAKLITARPRPPPGKRARHRMPCDACPVSRRQGWAGASIPVGDDRAAARGGSTRARHRAARLHPAKAGSGTARSPGYPVLARCSRRRHGYRGMRATHRRVPPRSPARRAWRRAATGAMPRPRASRCRRCANNRVPAGRLPASPHARVHAAHAVSPTRLPMRPATTRARPAATNPAPAATRPRMAGGCRATRERRPSRAP